MITEVRTFTDAGILTLLAMFVLLSGCTQRSRNWQGLFTSSGVQFSNRDRELIHEFYKQYEFPPELADPEILARDPERRIEISAALPPGPGGSPLPVDLESRLSRLPRGYIRFRVGADVVLMDSRTREVLDVIYDVLP
jgi:hypothetical protein